MKLKKTELAAVAVTLAFAFFTAGYLLGRSQPVGGADRPALSVSVTPREAAGTGSQSGTPDVDLSTAVQDAPAPFGRININTASRSELTDLPGIGEQLAGRIVEYREQNGAFKTVEDIMNVNGIGEKKFEAVSDYITVD